MWTRVYFDYFVEIGNAPLSSEVIALLVLCVVCVCLGQAAGGQRSRLEETGCVLQRAGGAAGGEGKKLSVYTVGSSDRTSPNQTKDIINC